MRKTPIALACALAAVPGSTALATPHDHSDRPAPAAEARHEWQVEAARRATRQFRSVANAERAGYEPAVNCVEGMGYHYAHPDLTADRELDVRRPEILVYERRGGEMRLVALEYFRADADQDLGTDDDRPSLFGLGFDGPMEGHEPGMPIHYDLHAWLYKRNPDGRFAAYNPRVKC